MINYLPINALIFTVHTTFIKLKPLLKPVKLIELKEVVKRFGKTTVLEDVNLTIEEGDIIGVIGKSGSGKTTLLNLIGGFLRPSSGKVLHSFKITEKPANLHENLHKIKDKIGFAPQHNSFYPKLTVAENLMHFGQLYGLKKETVIGNVKSLLHATKLHSHRNKLAQHLSGGMQKRLDISCSLVHKPEILILDEPTDDLDPILQREIMWFLKQVNKQGVTLIVASHNLDLLEKTCNKIAIVHDGRVKDCGLISDFRKPFRKEHFTINLNVSDNKEKILSYINRLNVNKVVDKGHNIAVYPKNAAQTISSLLNIIDEEDLYDIDIRRPSLGDIFEKITMEDQ